MVVVSAHIDGLAKGLIKDQAASVLVKAAEDAANACLPILEDMASQTSHTETSKGVEEMTLDAPPEVMEDWEIMFR